jgi:hypothetical protein
VKRDKAAALKFLKRIMKKYGRPRIVVTDGLYSYPAAMKEIGNADRQEVGRRLNNRAENAHQPFRRRERAMQRLRSAKTLQKFSSIPFQSGASSPRPRNLQTETLGCAGRMGHGHGLILTLGFRLVAPNAYRDASDPILSDKAAPGTTKGRRRR